MSSPKFLVFKLKDLRIPALALLVLIALFAFLIIKNKTTQTFAPSTGYEDGQYIAGITLSDADMDLVVEVKEHNIVSISLSGLDETSSLLYKDLITGIDYINTYVTATQSLELPENGNTTTATMLLMDAVKVALSDDAHASLNTTYEKVGLTPSESTASLSSVDENAVATDETASSKEDTQAASKTLDADQDIFVDEFSNEDFPSKAETNSDNNTLTIEQ